VGTGSFAGHTFVTLLVYARAAESESSRKLSFRITPSTTQAFLLARGFASDLFLLFIVPQSYAPAATGRFPYGRQASRYASGLLDGQMAFLHNGSSAMANTNHTSHHPSLFSVPFAPEEYWQKENSSAPPIRYIEALKPCSLLGQRPSSVHSPFESWSSRKPTCRISRGYAPRHSKRGLFCPIYIRRFHNMLWLRVDIRGRGYLSPGPIRLPILGIKIVLLRYIQDVGARLIVCARNNKRVAGLGSHVPDASRWGSPTTLL
jgi:hypothetical protein